MSFRSPRVTPEQSEERDVLLRVCHSFMAFLPTNVPHVRSVIRWSDCQIYKVITQVDGVIVITMQWFHEDDFFSLSTCTFFLTVQKPYNLSFFLLFFVLFTAEGNNCKKKEEKKSLLILSCSLIDNCTFFRTSPKHYNLFNFFFTLLATKSNKCNKNKLANTVILTKLTENLQKSRPI